MLKLSLDIRPISLDEWLPDRCLGGGRPIDPEAISAESGCSSLDWFYTHGSREKLVDIYLKAIEEYGGCGFVAWLDDKIVGYHTFFPREMARKIKFFGWGNPEDASPNTLVHNCVTHIRGDYSRKKIGTHLVKRSLAWGKENGWKRFEVHLVLPDIEDGFRNEQKSCRTFWEKFGLMVYRTKPASEETRKEYGVDIRYSMAVDLTEWFL
jgi:GNAT superfamily N-acetyltransferase